MYAIGIQPSLNRPTRAHTRFTVKSSSRVQQGRKLSKHKTLQYRGRQDAETWDAETLANYVRETCDYSTARGCARHLERTNINGQSLLKMTLEQLEKNTNGSEEIMDSLCCLMNTDIIGRTIPKGAPRIDQVFETASTVNANFDGTVSSLRVEPALTMVGQNQTTASVYQLNSFDLTENPSGEGSQDTTNNTELPCAINSSLLNRRNVTHLIPPQDKARECGDDGDELSPYDRASDASYCAENFLQIRAWAIAVPPFSPSSASLADHPETAIAHAPNESDLARDASYVSETPTYLSPDALTTFSRFLDRQSIKRGNFSFLTTDAGEDCDTSTPPQALVPSARADAKDEWEPILSIGTPSERSTVKYYSAKASRITTTAHSSSNYETPSDSLQSSGYFSSWSVVEEPPEIRETQARVPIRATGLGQESLYVEDDRSLNNSSQLRSTLDRLSVLELPPGGEEFKIFSPRDVINSDQPFAHRRRHRYNLLSESNSNRSASGSDYPVSLRRKKGTGVADSGFAESIALPGNL